MIEYPTIGCILGLPDNKNETPDIFVGLMIVDLLYVIERNRECLIKYTGYVRFDPWLSRLSVLFHNYCSWQSQFNIILNNLY